LTAALSAVIAADAVFENLLARVAGNPYGPPASNERLFTKSSFQIETSRASEEILHGPAGLRIILQATSVERVT
jgi:hypothetical protein